jgi:hypothetical protein
VVVVVVVVLVFLHNTTRQLLVPVAVVLEGKAAVHTVEVEAVDHQVLVGRTWVGEGWAGIMTQTPEPSLEQMPAVAVVVVGFRVVVAAARILVVVVDPTVVTDDRPVTTGVATKIGGNRAMTTTAVKVEEVLRVVVETATLAPVVQVAAEVRLVQLENRTGLVCNGTNPMPDRILRRVFPSSQS